MAAQSVALVFPTESGAPTIAPAPVFPFVIEWRPNSRHASVTMKFPRASAELPYTGSARRFPPA